MLAPVGVATASLRRVDQEVSGVLPKRDGPIGPPVVPPFPPSCDAILPISSSRPALSVAAPLYNLKGKKADDLIRSAGRTVHMVWCGRMIVYMRCGTGGEILPSMQQYIHKKKGGFENSSDQDEQSAGALTPYPPRGYAGNKILGLFSCWPEARILSLGQAGLLGSVGSPATE